MITAWPTSSPVNVTPTSTPLYYYTPYPSVGSNETGGGLLGLAASLTGSGSQTSIIIGSVALGVVGLAAIGGAVAYFRGGGTASGFVKKLESQKGALTQFANALPLSEAEKAKLTGAIADPTSLIPEQQRAQMQGLKDQAEQAKAKLEELKGQVQAKAEELKGQALQAQDSILQVLPSSVADAVRAKEAEIAAQVQAQVQAQVRAKQAEIQQMVNSYVPTPVASLAASALALSKPEPSSVEQPEQPEHEVPPPPQPSPAVEEAVAAAVHIAIDAEDIKAIKAFLAEKAKSDA